MTARRATSLMILGAFLALAVLSVLGNPVLGAIFIVVSGAVMVRHAVSLCPKCSNRACAFNPRFADSDRGAGESTGLGLFSDLPITRTTVVAPLLLAGPLAFIGAWQFSPVAAVAIAVVALSAHSVLTKLACSHCGNDCAGDRNARYRGWKTELGAWHR